MGKVNTSQVKYVRLPFKNKVYSDVFVNNCIGFGHFIEIFSVWIPLKSTGKKNSLFHFNTKIWAIFQITLNKPRDSAWKLNQST